MTDLSINLDLLTIPEDQTPRTRYLYRYFNLLSEERWGCALDEWDSVRVVSIPGVAYTTKKEEFLRRFEAIFTPQLFQRLFSNPVENRLTIFAAPQNAGTAEVQNDEVRWPISNALPIEWKEDILRCACKINTRYSEE
jgi:hypothetical protein